ncbi:MAG TPA: YidC/Oxa1 family membrane protein insertase [Actinomycetota bacterium]|nr:YidC/Oxa1 family membrane protein insertase [Actinomycetota bacterium]
MAFAPWQALLDALGWVLAKIFELVPNYGVSIILLTVVIRLVLLPLGIKQIRSMQHMQIVQPRIKQIQQKFKGNKQRQQEEIMKLYREYGVNPFSGCWPVLLQFPILIAMYSVLRWPQHPIHVPLESELCVAVSQQIPQQIPVCDPNGEPITGQAQIDELQLPGPPEGTTFLATNLLCSAGLPWQEAPSTLPDRVTGPDGEAVEIVYPVDCATSPLERVPYYVFAVLMFATTFYQQRQMQKASPPGAASSQQQALLKVMPILFGVFGIFFPAGLVLYWTTSNLWQIGQQHFMLKSRPSEEDMTANARSKPQKAEKKGFMASMMDRAEKERQRRDPGAKPGSGKPGNPKSGTPKPGTKKPGSGPRKPGNGGGGGGDPKKRPKR